MLPVFSGEKLFSRISQEKTYPTFEMAVVKFVANPKKAPSEVMRWTHQREFQYDDEKMSLHGEKFQKSYPEKTLEISIGIQFRSGYAPRQKETLRRWQKKTSRKE